MLTKLVIAAMLVINPVSWDDVQQARRDEAVAAAVLVGFGVANLPLGGLGD